VATGLALWLKPLFVKLPPVVAVQLTAKVAPATPSPMKATSGVPLLLWKTVTSGAFGAAPAGTVDRTRAVALNAARLVNSAIGLFNLRCMVLLQHAM
jgi:hypothetical protein